MAMVELSPVTKGLMRCSACGLDGTSHQCAPCWECRRQHPHNQLCRGKTLHVELPHPVSINRAYKSGRNRATGKLTFYSTPEYKQWKDDAWALCKAAGWRKLDPETKLQVTIELYTNRSDLDCGIKAACDVVQHVLDVNDRNIVRLAADKTTVPRAEQRMLLRVKVWQT